MNQQTKLRMFGGCILLINLYVIGHYNLEGFPALLLTLGFAVGYEYLVVRPVISPKAEAGGAEPLEEDPALYDQAISEIRERRVIHGVWAQAFAEADGDQKRTMARYIALRVAQMQSLQIAPEVAQGKAPRWQWALQLAGMLVLVTLLGPVPGVLAVAAFVWLKPKFGGIGAVASAGVIGICTIVATTLLFPDGAKPQKEALSQKEWEWESGVVTPAPSPTPAGSFDPRTISPTDPPPAPTPLGSDSTVRASGQTEAHYATIYAAHPDADQIADSPLFKHWLSTSPTNQRIMQEGNADQVIAMFTAFKAQQMKSGSL